jgi:hypothetical protein
MRSLQRKFIGEPPRLQDRYIRRLLRLHQVVAYSGQSGCSQECAVLFVQFGNEKRFFVMAIT